VAIRSILSYYLYNKCNWKLKEIGAFFSPGIKHHTTIIHAIRNVEDQLSLRVDNELKTHIKNIGL
jgi:chromosomal replication initiation ATPase DnaA